VKRGWIVIVLLISLGMNLGLLLSALLGRPGDSPPRRGGPVAGVERMAAELELAPEERRRFIERHRQFFEAARGPRAHSGELRQELLAELGAESPDEARLEAVVAESAEQFAQLELETVALVLEVRRTLPPEKREQYLRLVARLLPPGPGRPAPGTQRGGRPQ
jgi:hypothetical protein